jgi:hypothetical protein
MLSVVSGFLINISRLIRWAHSLDENTIEELFPEVLPAAGAVEDTGEKI